MKISKLVNRIPDVYFLIVSEPASCGFVSPGCWAVRHQHHHLGDCLQSHGSSSVTPVLKPALHLSSVSVELKFTRANSIKPQKRMLVKSTGLCSKSVCSCPIAHFFPMQGIVGNIGLGTLCLNISILSLSLFKINKANWLIINNPFYFSIASG